MRPRPPDLTKAATGIRGFDEITGGGLPTGRASLIVGGPGAGKSLFGLEFLVRGAELHGEPGVLLAFEETAEELVQNAASVGFDLPALEAEQRLVVDAVRVDPAEYVTTGAFDLEGLFIRLAAAVQAVGARRVVLDTVEVLFGALGDEAVVRGEFARLLRWLKQRGLTTVITGERGRDGRLTRYGIEEYVSDCVVVLDHRARDEVATRRLRVVKYRGSGHGTNEYPFLIRGRGLCVWPITSVDLSYPVSDERISLGVPPLDQMLGGGVFRGSAVLLGGVAGSGKTTLAALAVDAACRRGERAVFVSFEESSNQLVRNLRSVGVDLGRWVQQGRLRFHCERASAFGLEAHAAGFEEVLDDFAPTVVAVDSLAGFTLTGTGHEVTSVVTRELAMMKTRGITGLITSLVRGGAEGESTTAEISSLIDCWLLLRNVESDGERNRLLFVLKNRGSAHSNQVREFRITDEGVQLLDVVIGPTGVLTGSARARAVAEQSAAAAVRAAELERRRAALDRRTVEVEARIALLQEQLATQRAELAALAAESGREESVWTTARATVARGREAVGHPGGDGPDSD